VSKFLAEFLVEFLVAFLAGFLTRSVEFALALARPVRGFDRNSVRSSNDMGLT